MGAHGEVALRAVRLICSGAADSPTGAWKQAAREVFPQRHSQQKKSCPRLAFLGLCEGGWVDGVPSNPGTSSSANKRYAVRAAELLFSDPKLADRSPQSLWKLIMEDGAKVHNSQMDVVLALYRAGLLIPASAVA